MLSRFRPRFGYAVLIETIDWVVSIDSTIARVHQHGATLKRDTGGSAKSQESVVRAA
jgi:hypothetical protein